MIHEATPYARYQSYRQHKGYTMEMKSKLNLRIRLLINYMMKEICFLHRLVSFKACSLTCHAASHVSFLSRSSMYYIMLTPHNPLNPLNFISAHSFS